jgi:hypothetical protein
VRVAPHHEAEEPEVSLRKCYEQRDEHGRARRLAWRIAEGGARIEEAVPVLDTDVA